MTRFTLPPDHPALPGHFPGRPIVPGVLLLDAVIQAAGGATHIRRAKFLAPVAPGEEVEILLEPRPGGGRAFTCRRGKTIVLTGEI